MKHGYIFIILITLPVYLFCQLAPAGLGTMESPYLIESLDNLYYVSIYTNNYLNGKYFKQTEDIDAQNTQTFYNGAGFYPIGGFSEPFQGFYDGQGHTIDNLYINRNSAYIGLFGKAQGAEISNLNLKNINFSGERFMGGIVGYAIGVSIYNSSSEGIINANTGYYAYCGGIVGTCVDSSEIINCYSKTTITASSRIGGITGFIESDTIIQNCFYSGDLTANNYIGGMVGFMYNQNDTSIINCYSVANISYVDASYCGMLVGKNESLNISSCIYEENNVLPGIGNGSGITNFDSTSFQGFSPTQMLDPATYINKGWDFATTWFLDDTSLNNGYPYLYWQQENPYSLFVINDGNSQNLSAPEINLELDFDSELPLGTQIMVTKHSSENTPMNGLTISQQALASEFWRIKTTYTNPIAYDLSLNLTDIELPANLEQVKILKREDENSDWVNVIDLGAQLLWQEKSITISGLTSFSDFIPVIEEATLPVELSSFSVDLSSNDSVNLQWEVESESNLVGYYILYNNINDLSTAQIIPSLVHAINTSQYHCYNFVHHLSANDIDIFYWLKSVELGNQEEIYGPVHLYLDNNPNSTPPFIPRNQLFAPYPNPFNPTTTISFSVEKPQFVEIDIYNVKGQLIRNMLSKFITQTNKKHSLVWDGKDNKSQNVSSDIYFIKMQFERESIIRKLLMIK